MSAPWFLMSANATSATERRKKPGMHPEPRPAEISLFLPAKHRGFTLVELLVVMAIISVLAAMLLPVLSKARNEARTVICIGNLKQGGVAFTMYASDYDGLLPRIAKGNPDAPYARSGWDFVLVRYLGGKGFGTPPTLKPHPFYSDSQGRLAGDNAHLLTFYCPNYTRLADFFLHTPNEVWGRPKLATWAPYWGIGSYQMNDWLGLYGQAIHNNRYYQLQNSRANIYKMRSGTLLMYEPVSEWGLRQETLYYNPLHGNRCPLLFADGHVRLHAAQDVPAGAYEWSFNPTTRSEAERNFYGWYLLIYYANPASYPWPPESQW